MVGHKCHPCLGPAVEGKSKINMLLRFAVPVAKTKDKHNASGNRANPVVKK